MFNDENTYMKTKRYKIEEMIPVIKYYKSNNWCKGIKISLNDEIFTLKED